MIEFYVLEDKMLRSLKNLRGYDILAIDGEMGEVHEFYFDDEEWIIRYLVADTGNWLPGRRVLISPVALEKPDWDLKKFPVLLHKDEIKKSPHISKDEPVSRQHEEEMSEYYNWPPYWNVGALGMPPAQPVTPKDTPEKDKTYHGAEKEGDPHLRSSREVIGYHIQAIDDEVGHVEDFLVDDESWTLRYLVIDTRNWLPGKKVVISPLWVKDIKWEDKKAGVDLTRNSIKNSPEYDPSTPINREYEERLFDYYGRPKYWH
jgi:hypothetical protein